MKTNSATLEPKSARDDARREVKLVHRHAWRWGLLASTVLEKTGIERFPNDLQLFALRRTRCLRAIDAIEFLRAERAEMDAWLMRRSCREPVPAFLEQFLPGDE